jgi:hypothetical protein
MSSNDYNGWTNYETWNVNLWIQNDEGLYGFVRDGLEELLDRYGSNWENVSLTDLKELVRDAFGSNKTPDGVSLMDAAIDWDEISDALLELAEGENLQVRAEAFTSPITRLAHQYREELELAEGNNIQVRPDQTA